MNYLKFLINKVKKGEKIISNALAFSYLSLQPLYKMVVIGVLLLATLSLIIYGWHFNKNNMVLVASDGGRLTEGLIGSPNTINPLLAVSGADRTLTSLIYSGLLRLDGQGNLQPDITKKYEISEDGLEYTFTLKNNIFWHDGERLTADDIIFTINKIQNPTLKSPRRINWEGVRVEKINNWQVKFILEKPYAPFLHNLTLGIMPEHLWQDIFAENFSLSTLNQNPVGSGPFTTKQIRRNKNGVVEFYDLRPFDKYHSEKPKISLLRLRFYPNEEELVSAYKRNDIDSWSSSSLSNKISHIDKDLIEYQMTLPRIFGVFFNQNQAEIFINPEIREALELATCRKIIVEQMIKKDKEASIIKYPFLQNLNAEEDIIPWEKRIDQAKEILKKAGWQEEGSGTLTKGSGDEKITFSFSLITSNSSELKEVAETLKGCWEKIGARVETEIYESGRLNQDFIPARRFDALLFGLSVGREPDLFAYWHSSQRSDPGLNIANYANIEVDSLLEQARQVINKEERFEIYRKVGEIIREENPAIFIYTPRFSYYLPNSVQGIEFPEILLPVERFSQIHKWYTKTDNIWKIFAQPENIINQ